MDAAGIQKSRVELRDVTRDVFDARNKMLFFAWYHEILWALCDEMTALRVADDADRLMTEKIVINQFAQGIHDRLVRRDEKWCRTESYEQHLHHGFSEIASYAEKR